MGDNYSPPEDASQNQNYQQLVFAIPRRHPLFTHTAALAYAAVCVGQRRRLREAMQAAAFFWAEIKEQSRSLVHLKAQENTGYFNSSEDDNRRKEYLTRCHYGKEHYLEAGHSDLGHYPDRYWHYAGGYFVLVGARGRRKGWLKLRKEARHWYDYCQWRAIFWSIPNLYRKTL